MRKILCCLVVLFVCRPSYPQDVPLKKIDFLLGKWQGIGEGFGNERSKIESAFHLAMDGKYLEIRNDSRFVPTESKPEGEHHQDWGMVSFDKTRKILVFRQFNNEEYVNQYVLNDSLTSDTVLVFETEVIENFIPGGSARWTINKISEDEIETVFEVFFPGKEFTCFGRNRLKKIM